MEDTTTYVVISANGVIIDMGECAVDEVADQPDTGAGEIVISPVPAGVSDETHYYKSGGFKTFPSGRQDYHDFNYSAEAWVDGRASNQNDDFSRDSYDISPEIELSGNTLIIKAFTATRDNGVYVQSKSRSQQSWVYPGSPRIVAYNYDTNSSAMYASRALALAAGERVFLLGEFRGPGVFMPSEHIVNGERLALQSVLAENIADGAFTVAKFAQGIRPIEIVPALPTAGNFKGRMVFLESDNKLYRHTGSPAGSGGYTAAADGADIIANTLTGGKFVAGAVGTRELAAGAATISKLAVTDATNQVPDSELQDADAWVGVPSDGTGVFQLRPDSTFSGKKTPGDIVWWNSRATPGVSYQATTQKFPVAAGDELFLSGQIFNSGSGTTVSAYADVTFYDATDTGVLTQTIGIKTSTGGTNTFTNSVMVPAGAVRMRFRWFVNAANDYTLVFATPIVKIKNAGHMYVDGSIDAAKLNVTELSAITANLGTIEVDEAHIKNLSVGTSKVQDGAINGFYAWEPTTTAPVERNIPVVAGRRYQLLTVMETTSRPTAGWVGAHSLLQVRMGTAPVGDIDLNATVLGSDYMETPEISGNTATFVSLWQAPSNGTAYFRWSRESGSGRFMRLTIQEFKK